MVSRMVKINSEVGLHLRPAGILCKKAMEYPCHIEFRYGNIQANAKSVLSVLGAGVKGGSEIELCCNGPQEEEALNALVTLIEKGLE